MRTLLFLSLFFGASFSAFAQTTTTVAGEAAAREFFKALQTNDAKTLQNFVASKETYLQIVAEYEYSSEAKREKARSDVQTAYEKQTANILKSFQDTRTAISTATNIADCNVTAVQVRDQHKKGLPGGRAVLQISNAAQNEIVLILRGFYEFKGKWYIMNDVTLRKARAVAGQE